MLLSVLGAVCVVSVAGAETANFEETDLLQMSSLEDAGQGEERSASMWLCVIYGLLTLFAILFSSFYPRRRNMHKWQKK